MKVASSLLIQIAVLGGLTVSVAQTRKPVPTLTTDDVVTSRPAAPPTVPTKAVDARPEKDEKSASTAKAKSASPTEDAAKIAEKAWNEKLRKAQEKTRGLELQADQTELMITQLRNQLFSAEAKSPETSGQINARIAELSTQTKRLRAEAKTAQQEVETLQAEGTTNQYKTQQLALTNEKGEPDSQAFQQENDKLQGELQAATARVEVLQLRLSNNHAEMLKKASGDNFALNRLREEKEQLTDELEKTRLKIAELNKSLESHRQKATSVGVPIR